MPHERNASFLEDMNNLRARFYLDLDSYGRLFCHKGPLLRRHLAGLFNSHR